jgi:hypothetical protein
MKTVYCVLATIALNICISDYNYLHAMEAGYDEETEHKMLLAMKTAKNKFKDPKYNPSPDECDEILKNQIKQLQTGDPVKMAEAFATVKTRKLDEAVKHYPNLLEELTKTFEDLSKDENP